MDSGVAREPIDIQKYQELLEETASEIARL
jgi:hypothetical protein